MRPACRARPSRARRYFSRLRCLRPCRPGEPSDGPRSSPGERELTGGSPSSALARPPSSAYHRSSTVVLRIVARGVGDHASLRRAQQPLDPVHLVEPLVDAKADVGREFEVTRWAISPRREALCRSSASSTCLPCDRERHGHRWWQAAGRRQAHLGNGDEMGLPDRVMHVAARRISATAMANNLAGAQRGCEGAFPGLGDGVRGTMVILPEKNRRRRPEPPLPSSSFQLTGSPAGAA